MTTINISSDDIKIYPAGNRSDEFDFDATHITEHNIANKYNDIVDIKSYVLSGMNISLKDSATLSISKGSCIISGYKIELLASQYFNITDLSVDQSYENAIILELDLSNMEDEKLQENEYEIFKGIKIKAVENTSEVFETLNPNLILGYLNYVDNAWVITNNDNAFKISTNNLKIDLNKKYKLSEIDINSNISTFLNNLSISDTIDDYSNVDISSLTKSLSITNNAQSQSNLTIEVTRVESLWAFAEKNIQLESGDNIYVGDVLDIYFHSNRTSVPYNYRPRLTINNSEYFEQRHYIIYVDDNLSLIADEVNVSNICKTLTINKSSGNLLFDGASISVFKTYSVLDNCNVSYQVKSGDHVYVGDILRITCYGNIDSYTIKNNNVVESSGSNVHEFEYVLTVAGAVRIDVKDRWLHWIDLGGGGAYRYEFLTPDSINLGTSYFKQKIPSTQSSQDNHYSKADPTKIKRWDITVHIYDSNVQDHIVTRTYSTYSEEASFEGDWANVDGPIVGYGCQFHINDVYAAGQNSGDDYVSISVTGPSQLEIYHYYEWKVGPPMPQDDVTYITGIDVCIYQYQIG